jgi:hypothetical protein
MILALILASFIIVVLRIYFILPRAKEHRLGSKQSKKSKIAIFLGSG